jgi:excinuclease ABC subunit B
VKGKVVLYADTITDSMRRAIEENNRRRRKQVRYNKKHGIEPKTIVKGMYSVMDRLRETLIENENIKLPENKDEMGASELQQLIDDLTFAMTEAADNLEFELAAELRDQIRDLKKKLVIEQNS